MIFQGSNFLLRYTHNVTSQHGEDGIIEQIFLVLGEKNRWCLEVGALNGTHDSNSWNLVHNRGWQALLIEADMTQFRKLAKLHEDNSRVRCVNAFVSFEGEHALDALCAGAGMPRDFDLLVIDIDGADYHLWESLVRFEPRVVCIEFNPTIPNDVAFVQPRDMGVNQGSSLAAIAELGKQKGYALVGTTAGNAFFVKKKDAGRFGIDDFSLDALHPDTTYQTKLFQLYDGTLMLAGYDRLLWHRLPIDREKLQILPRRKRRYPAHIDESERLRHFKDWARRSPLYWLYGILKKLL